MKSNDLRLGPNRRIKKRQDFLRIQSEGRKVRSENLLLAYCPRISAEGSTPVDSRIGTTITRKIDKRAVVRNRIERRLKELFRMERRRFVAPFDVVVVALTGASELEFEEIASQFRFLLRKARILPNRPQGPRS